MVNETEQDEARDLLEQGQIFFVYRPKVHAEGDAEAVAAEKRDDVEDLHPVLQPHGGRFH